MIYIKGVSLITPFLHKKTFLYIDSEGDQEKHDFKESLNYFPLYFIHHLMSQKTRGFNRLLDDPPKILLIQEDIEFSYFISNLEIKNYSHGEFTEKYLNEFDFIINTLDNRYNNTHRGQLFLDEKISSMSLRSEITYISLKAKKADWKKEKSFFDQKITETHRPIELSETDKDLLTKNQDYVNFGHLDYSKDFEILFKGIYGPWPLKHLDFTAQTFPQWPVIDQVIVDLKEKLKKLT